MKKVTLVLGVFCLANSSMVFAQENIDRKREPNAEKIMERLDLNQDGKLSTTEVEASKKPKLIENFDKIDRNKDGFIDTAELNAMIERRKKHKQ